MRILSGAELLVAERWMDEAAKVALRSGCQRARCGSVIIAGNFEIGYGFNSPPDNLESQRRCSSDKSDLDKKVSDKTCCVHAEQRAIINALKRHAASLRGASLYFTRIDEEGKIIFSGEPYCTICSKMALDVGIKYFVLWKSEGMCCYDTEEYNLASFNYKG